MVVEGLAALGRLIQTQANYKLRCALSVFINWLP